LRSLGDDERSFWVDRLIEKLKVVDRRETSNLMLTWDDVRIMHKNGIAFGSHTTYHPILSRLSADKVRKEVYESKKILEDNLGAPVKTFAYPSGRKEDYNQTTKEILKEAGYTCALTSIFGANDCDQDPFELRRGTPWETYLPTFAVKINWYKYRFLE
jgi:peptidoglycan/xylan/chitin deacetylase (PgdA/CDA1 family)